MTFVADGSIHVPHHIFLSQDGSPELWTDHPEYLVGAPGSMVGGSLIGELNKLDIDVDDIDAVLLSHLHADHVGWLTTDTASGPKLTFGQAEHFVAKAEHQFWELLAL